MDIDTELAKILIESKMLEPDGVKRIKDLFRRLIEESKPAYKKPLFSEREGRNGLTPKEMEEYSSYRAECLSKGECPGTMSGNHMWNTKSKCFTCGIDKDPESEEVK